MSFSSTVFKLRGRASCLRAQCGSDMLNPGGGGGYTYRQLIIFFPEINFFTGIDRYAHRA